MLATKNLEKPCKKWFLHKAGEKKMTNSKTVAEMQNEIKAFCEERDWDQFHNPKDLAIGISTEANELLDIFRFHSGDEIKKIFSDTKKREHVEEEIADTLFFVLRFAQMNNIDLPAALDNKLKKNAEKYPVEKCKGKNLKYTEIK
jgi:NTP pyrophosphatase (non-canonical NTP hydrolase)